MDPENAVLTLSAYDEDVMTSTFIAFSAIPLPNARSGLRSIPLYNAEGKREQEFSFAALFVRVGITPI